MVKNYLKITLRNVERNWVYSSINVAGLAMGLAVCLIIGLFVQNELSYDRFHEDADRIYRVVQDESGEAGLAWSGPQMGLRLKQDFPQLEGVMRFIAGGSGYGSRALISYEDKSGGEVMRFNEEGFLYADPEFFTFFSFPLIAGSVDDVLNRPGTVVVTESMARKYFGNDDPLGKTLLLNNRFPLEVTGVASDPSVHSHLDFHFVASYRTFYANQGIPGEVNSFWWPPTHTYVKLHPDASASALNDQLPAFGERHRDADDNSRMTTMLQPLTEIWLGPDYRGQQQAGGSMAYIYLFSAVAVFILVLACVNFINLATARAGKRAKEVGVRKAAGAARSQLVTQFLAESLLLSLAATALAFLLAELLLPFFNGIAAKQVAIPYADGAFWLMVSAVVVATGLAAGAYPALYLSGFRPALAVGNSAGQWARGTGLRKGLVVFQFTVSMVLLAGTAVVYQQLRYTTEARMGFDKEHVVMLPGTGFSGAETGARYETLRSELLERAGVMQVTATSHRPGLGSGSTYVWEAEGLPPDPNRQLPVQFVGDDFFGMLEVDMVSGRPLRADDPADIGTSRVRTDQDIQTDILENRAIVINETAARQMGWEPQEAHGKQMRFYVVENENIYQDYRGTVAGVVEDYHTDSLHEPIGPVAYMTARSPDGGYLTLNHILVRMAPGNVVQSLQMIEQTWKETVTDLPFEAVFLSESLDNLYRNEIRMGKLITAFTILAVFIACLGLLGLAAYTAETRTKEIGVRKILGATTGQIVTLLSADFIKLVIAGFIIAAPIAWLVSNQWLQNFEYRVDIGWQLFIMVGFTSIFLALLTVSWQSVKAALINPVESLRSE
jgi:putative ABC transport system permease protein